MVCGYMGDNMVLYFKNHTKLYTRCGFLLEPRLSSFFVPIRGGSSASFALMRYNT